MQPTGDDAIFYDTSPLSGDDAPISLAAFLAANSGPDVEPLPDEEIAALRSCDIDGTVNLGIGGGFITVRRIAAPVTFLCENGEGGGDLPPEGEHFTLAELEQHLAESPEDLAALRALPVGGEHLLDGELGADYLYTRLL